MRGKFFAEFGWVRHLGVTVIGALTAVLSAGVCGRTRLAAAGKVQDALELAVVEEEVEGPHIAHLTCTMHEH